MSIFIARGTLNGADFRNTREVKVLVDDESPVGPGAIYINLSRNIVFINNISLNWTPFGTRVKVLMFIK